MRILLVSQFWPGDADPDFGVFVAAGRRELERRGHEVDRAVIDRRGAGRAGDAQLLRDALRLRAAAAPDVVFAHFLLPAGAGGAAASLRRARAARRHGPRPGRRERRRRAAAVRRATARVVRRAHTVIFNSRVPRATACRSTARTQRGHRLRRRPRAVSLRDADRAMRQSGPDRRPGLPVRRVAHRAQERRPAARRVRARSGADGSSSSATGRCARELEGRDGIRAARAACRTTRCPGTWPPPTSSCLPEPRASRSARCCSRRWRRGARWSRRRSAGRREFVTPEAGALVDPHDVESIRAGARARRVAADAEPGARAPPPSHDVRRQARGWRSPCCFAA